jgi:hypothetical protein
MDHPDRERQFCTTRAYFHGKHYSRVGGQFTDELNRLMTALLEAELNSNYLYSFIPHPHGKSILA